MHKGSIKGIVKYTLIKNLKLTIAMFVTIVGAIIFALLPPLVLEDIVDNLTKGKGVSLEIAFLYFALLILAGMFDAVKEICITKFGQRVTHRTRSEMCQKLSSIRTAYFTQNESGAITSRFVNDVDTVEVLFSNGVISMFVDGCKVVSIVIVIFIKSKGLGLLLIAFVPVLYLLTRWIQKKMLGAQKANRIAVAKVNGHIPETIQNIRTIHNLVKEDYMEKRYDEKIQESYHAVDQSNLYDSIYSPIIVMISTLLIALLMIMAALGGEWQAFFGISVGTAVAVISYVGKVFEPIESIGMEIQNIQSAVAGISRINEFLTEKEEEAKDTRISLTTLLEEKNRGISFENVSFSYEDELGAGRKVIDHFSFYVREGEMVTLAGRTGAGKSTIFKLLLGLYEPQEGKVCIFGKEAGMIPNKEKRRLFGYVAQSFYMVPGTVAEQISLFDKDISQEDVENAAKLVGLHQSILALKDGYSTVCTAFSFSQGQLQLLSIARAVVLNPPILLLDEITANLDSITEQKVFLALERAAQGRTLLSISHRLYQNAQNGLPMHQRVVIIK